MTLDVGLGLAIFVVTFGLIASERIHKTTAAMGGGVAMVLLGVVSQERAFEEIDFNVIFLLAGMMILAAIMRKTGIFGWVGIRAARIARGEPYRLTADGSAYRLDVHLPFTQGDGATARQFGDEVVIQLGNQRRNYALPKFLAYYTLADTRLEDGWFRLRFEPATH